VYFLWKFLFGFEVKGRKFIPIKGRILVAANHLSNFDPPLIGTAIWVRESFFFAKEELFKVNPFFSWLIKVFNAYPVKLNNIDLKAIKWTTKLLQEGKCVIVFPEGTRNRNFLKFHPGIGWFAINTKTNVIPTAIKFSNTPLITQLLRIHRPKINFGAPILWKKFRKNKKGYKEMTEEIEKKVKELYESI
jgi:1-acyl-sn-glycerol-3-phosphate acyltransferase